MDYSQFLNMREELSLIAVLLLLFLADLFMSPDAHKNSGKARLNTMLPVILMAIHTAINLIPGTAADAFGGMYHYVPMHTVVKSILNVGTLIVFLMAHEWMKREDTSFKQGEFYVLTLSTLFGMYLMISAGHFLMFFIGLETASIPMAALIAFDKYRHNSAEAGAKYILTALFSSALLLFGLSMIYGSAGTLYFDDLPAHIDGNPLQIMAFIFFFTGMAFKLSLVPFHLWTADVYEGAPSTVTAYLSVISKGSAAFVLLAVLIKVFAPMINDWQEVLYWVTIASITIANIFAVRQQNLKRLMAFSSISQAGYIMLGVIGGTAQGMTAQKKKADGTYETLETSYDSDKQCTTVILPMQDIESEITVVTYNTALADNHQVERIFELLNRAEIEFSLKEKIYAIAQKKGSRNDAYLLDQLTLLNAPEDVFGAVKEILTALD